jgi:hypothetical protein
LEAQAINISGGTKPSRVSDTRKKVKIMGGEYVSTRLLSNELKSRKNISSARIIMINIKITHPPLTAVSLRKE